MTVLPEGSFLEWLRLRSTGPLSPREVTHFIYQAANTLQYAHNLHIIYQKVAPSNYLVRSNYSTPLDFQLIDITKATSPDGLPNDLIAIAPEQWRGTPVPATDQYALAILAYQLLTWQSPFQGTQEQVMYQHLNVQPQPPSRLNPRLPPALDAVILRALAKKPEDRFPNIATFAVAFRQAVQAPDPPPAAQLSSMPANNTITPEQPSPMPNPLPVTNVPASNPDLTAINRTSRTSHIRELLLLGLVFIIVVSGIGYGFYALEKSNQAALTNSNVSVHTTTTPSAETANAATALARTITSGKPIFADALSSNTSGLWNSDAKMCVFKGGTYHVHVSTADTVNGCGLNKLTFDNVALQADVTLLSGNNAGLYFCYNTTSGLFYLFTITNQGKFFFAIMNGTTPYSIIQPTKTNAIATGNARNTLLVISKGSDFKFFINGVFVGETQDNTLTGGQIGFLAQTSKAETNAEASFSNIKVWSTSAN